jgi:hypothetical protein
MLGTGHSLHYIDTGANSPNFESLIATDHDHRSLRLPLLGRLHQLLQLFSHFFRLSMLPIRLRLILELSSAFLSRAEPDRPPATVLPGSTFPIARI